jgi:ATP-binding cassette subfamily C exporter for protease/lipase
MSSALTTGAPAGSVMAPGAAAPSPLTDPSARAPALSSASAALRDVVQGFRREIAWVGVFSFFANLLLLAPTLYMLQVFDRVLVSGSGLTLVALSAVTLLLIGWMALAEWLRSRLLVRTGVRLDELMGRRVFDASFASTLARPRPETAQAAAYLAQVRQFVTGNGAYALFDAPWVPVYLLVLFLMHPVLGWTALAFVGVMAALMWWSQSLTKPPLAASLEAAAATGSFLGAKLRNAETVEALGMVGALRRRWMALHQVQLARASEAAEVQARLMAVTKFVQYTQQSLMLAVAALLVIDAQLGLGAMVAANVLMSNALRPMSTLMASWKQLAETRDAWARLQSLLGTPVRAASEDAGRAAEPLRGEVTVRGLVAGAPGRAQPILAGIDASFGAGEIVAVLGPSGAGKSTFVRCLLGIWPGTEGEVQLDGRPVHDWPRNLLGPQLGYLPQDIELFDGTIAENIARLGAVDPERVIDAATRTGIHEMVLRFPKGYDTPMGEAGSLLSGGQRQRVGLARALYGRPRLLVLDEPNASLDDAGDAALARTLSELKQARCTVFMVTHQKHLLGLADRVLVLEGGRVTQNVTTAQPASSLDLAATLARTPK